jgi:hypothetical protein
MNFQIFLLNETVKFLETRKHCDVYVYLCENVSVSVSMCVPMHTHV